MQLHELPAPSGDQLSFHVESRERPALRLDIAGSEQLLLRDEPLAHRAGMVRFDAVLDLELLQLVECGAVERDQRPADFGRRSVVGREMQRLDDGRKGQAATSVTKITEKVVKINRSCSGNSPCAVITGIASAAASEICREIRRTRSS